MKLFDILDYCRCDRYTAVCGFSVLCIPTYQRYGSYQYFYGYRDDLPIVENHRSLADAIA